MACQSLRRCPMVLQETHAGDLDAIAAYLRTVEPLRHEVPPPVYNAEAHRGDPRGEKSNGNEVPTDPVKRGFYLATLAHCMECHSRKPDGVHDFTIWG